MIDPISRQAAIDAHELLLKDCNPDHFVAHEKFIGFMDDTEIGSFGDWQFANGFNLALTAGEVAIKEQPSAERKGKWISGKDVPNRNPYYHLSDAMYCSECLNEAYWDSDYGQQMFDFCPYCGAKMERKES